MKNGLQLSIPTPCHESWNNMTPTEQGKFCAACSKQVTDFTVMTDQQLINYFTQQHGNTCGLFMKDQLERPITQRKEEKKKVWWLVLIMPAMFLFNRSNAQKKKGKALTQICAIEPTQLQGDVEVVKTEPLIGDTVYVTLSEKVIRGKVTDEKGLPLWGASIQLKGTRQGTSADSSGNFLITVKPEAFTKATVVISYVGYESKEVEVGYLKDQQEIVLDESDLMLGEYVTRGLTICTVVKKKKMPKLDTLNANLHKFLGRETFKVFPNPARRGEDVQVSIKKAGSYVIEVLDQQSKLINTTKYDAHIDGENVRVPIPVNITTGLYYIVLTDEKNKKRYTNKIIVE